MSGGGKVNKQMLQNQQQAQQQQQQMFNKMMEETPEQKRFRQGAANWDQYMAGKDYSKAPTDTILNFDLWNPAHTQKQQEKMSNLTGVGAAAMSGSGDQSIALSMAKDRNARLAAQDAGAAFENAVKQTDNYYKSGGLQWAGLDINKNMGLLSNATNRELNYNQAYVNTRPQPLLPSLFGGLLSMGGQALGNPSFFCWIAEELYGKDTYEVALIRSWLLCKAGTSRMWASLLDLYRKYGRDAASLIRRSSVARFAFRQIFNNFLRRAKTRFDDAV